MNDELKNYKSKSIIFLVLILMASTAYGDVSIGIKHKVPHDFFAQIAKAFKNARKVAQDPEMGKYPFYTVFSNEGKDLPIVMACKVGTPAANGNGCSILFLPAAPTPVGAISTTISLSLREETGVLSDQQLTELLTKNDAQTSQNHLHVLRPFSNLADAKNDGTHLYCAPEDSAVSGKKIWQCYISVNQRL